MWRVVLLAPLVVVAIQTVIFLTAIKTDPFMYSISTGDEVEAKKMMSRVFKKVPDGDSEKTLEQSVDL
jgi:hypothetical protein